MKKNSNLSRGMVWNFLSEALIATIILVYSLTEAYLNKPEEILKGIDRFFIFFILCALYLISDKYLQLKEKKKK